MFLKNMKKEDEEKPLKKVKLQEERNKRVKKVEIRVKSIKEYTIAIASLMKWKMNKELSNGTKN